MYEPPVECGGGGGYLATLPQPVTPSTTQALTHRNSRPMYLPAISISIGLATWILPNNAGPWTVEIVTEDICNQLKPAYQGIDRNDLLAQKWTTEAP